MTDKRSPFHDRCIICKSILVPGMHNHAFLCSLGTCTKDNLHKSFPSLIFHRSGLATALPTSIHARILCKDSPGLLSVAQVDRRI